MNAPQISTTAPQVVITDRQHAIARSFVIHNLEELLCWSDLDELLGDPFIPLERHEHAAERERWGLGEIEGVPLRGHAPH